MSERPRRFLLTLAMMVVPVAAIFAVLYAIAWLALQLAETPMHAVRYIIIGLVSLLVVGAAWVMSK